MRRPKWSRVPVAAIVLVALAILFGYSVSVPNSKQVAKDRDKVQWDTLWEERKAILEEIRVPSQFKKDQASHPKLGRLYQINEEIIDLNNRHPDWSIGEETLKLLDGLPR